LPNGNLFVAGGEYGTGQTNCEIYNSQSNTWTQAIVPAGVLDYGVDSQGGNYGFRDSGSMLLPNGNVLVAPVYPVTNLVTLIYSPATNSWSAGPATFESQDEAGWVKLPDNSILTVDLYGNTCERYIPSLNRWVVDTAPPVQLYDPYGSEEGPAFLLPNGKAIF